MIIADGLVIPDWLVYLAGWGTIMGAVYWFFHVLGEIASQPLRERVSRWIGGEDLSGISRSWPDTFVNLFDALFGNLLSFRGLIRSVLASGICIVLVAIFAFVLRPNEIALWLAATFELGGRWWIAVMALIMIPAIFNGLPDYLSLIETRWILGMLKRNQRLRNVLVLLVVDWVLTSAI